MGVLVVLVPASLGASAACRGFSSWVQAAATPSDLWSTHLLYGPMTYPPPGYNVPGARVPGPAPPGYLHVT
eukprot:794859-Rhodomonas_salina.5